MSADIMFENDDYQPSDSDNEYTETEKKLLKKVVNRQNEDSDTEQEVYGFDSEDSSGSEIALSDVEGQEDDELPDIRSWGRDAHKFYSTDYVDTSKQYQGKDVDLAEQEEEEMRNFEEGLAQDLMDGDFETDIFKKIGKPKIESAIRVETAKLSKAQKLELAEKVAPNFYDMTKLLKDQLNLVKEYLYPVVLLSRQGKLEKCEALDFINSFYQLKLNYATNISMYLYLASSEVKVKNHPILSRLEQYRQLVKQMEEIFNDVVKDQVEYIIKDEKVNIKKKTSKKLLNVLMDNLKKTCEKQECDKKGQSRQNKRSESIIDSAKSKVTEFDRNLTAAMEESSETEEEKEENRKEFDAETEVNNKRAITYEMAKNKGLTPRRKKEQRNPRVKHRNKFRKAKIRRKGAVREVRTELSRYSGEISGIKASVTKGVKIK